MDRGIRQISKGVWAVRAQIKDPRTGRTLNLKRTVQGSRADALRVKAELVAEVRTGPGKRARVQMRSFSASWLAQRESSLKPSVRMKYTTSLRLHIVPFLGDLYLDSITPADVRAYLASRSEAAGNTVLNELRLLRTIARDAVSEGLSDRYWCDRVAPPKVARYTAERPNLLNADQLEAVVAAIPRQWRGLVLFMVTTGLRWGEASGIRWSDVDRKAGIVTISRGNWKGREVTPKTEGSYRTVALLPEVADLLPPKRNRYVFTTQDGKLHSGSALRCVLDNAVCAAGLAHRPKVEGKRTRDITPIGIRVTAHGLRRTFNNLARQHTSAQVLRSITGHRTEAMTDHYSLVGSDEKLAVQRIVATAAGLQEKGVN